MKILVSYYLPYKVKLSCFLWYSVLLRSILLNINNMLLIFCLTEYEASKQENPVQLPKLIVFITGKGPQKEYYSNIINSLKLEHVNIYLPWLEHEDYPKILGNST
jgi:hypothetical protein